MTPTSLYIPANVKTRTEFFPGYGMAELTKSLLVAAIAGGLALIIYSSNKSATFAIVFLLASVAASVAVLVKDQNNQSVVDQIGHMIRFSRAQKKYPYRYRKEW